jgi:4a-hydroxytetrahydrobiopterin dehydratase
VTEVLTRQAISDDISKLGWRLVLGVLRSAVAVDSVALAVAVSATVLDVAGSGADASLRLDIRADRLELMLQSWSKGRVTATELVLAKRITVAVAELGLRLDPMGPRAVQALEIGIDAMDIPSIRPFWRAVLGYGDEPGETGPTDAVIDPVGQGPAIWFQQMDTPRPQRNRIHFDVSVPHDEAPQRIEATLAAGGKVVSDAEAPSFWVLADPEGNEACITTWQGRD